MHFLASSRRDLEKLSYKSIPSQANFIMFDWKKPIVPLIKAIKEKNVAVGRLPALSEPHANRQPNLLNFQKLYLRISK